MSRLVLLSSYLISKRGGKTFPNKEIGWGNFFKTKIFEKTEREIFHLFLEKNLISQN